MIPPLQSLWFSSEGLRLRVSQAEETEGTKAHRHELHGVLQG